MAERLQPVRLKNGIVIRFSDQTNRYFGDFHRLCVKVSIMLPEGLPLPAGMTRETACVEKTLQKMAVETQELEYERGRLVEAFLATSRNYLEKAEFPQRMLAQFRNAKRRPTLLKWP